MILGISILLSASICKYEKSKIDYCDKMVFLGSKVMVLLKTTNPETEKIFDLLNNSEKLKDIDEVAYVRFASVYKAFDSASSFIEEISKL